VRCDWVTVEPGVSVTVMHIFLVSAIQQAVLFPNICHSFTSINSMSMFTLKIQKEIVHFKYRILAPFTLVRFRKFCHGYTCHLHYAGIFEPKDFRKRRFSKTLQILF